MTARSCLKYFQNCNKKNQKPYWFVQILEQYPVLQAQFDFKIICFLFGCQKISRTHYNGWYKFRNSSLHYSHNLILKLISQFFGFQKHNIIECKKLHNTLYYSRSLREKSLFWGFFSGGGDHLWHLRDKNYNCLSASKTGWGDHLWQILGSKSKLPIGKQNRKSVQYYRRVWKRENGFRGWGLRVFQLEPEPDTFSDQSHT